MHHHESWICVCLLVIDGQLEAEGVEGRRACGSPCVFAPTVRVLRTQFLPEAASYGSWRTRSWQEQLLPCGTAPWLTHLLKESWSPARNLVLLYALVLQ